MCPRVELILKIIIILLIIFLGFIKSKPCSSSSFVRQLSYFQAGRCQPDPGVLVQVGQAPLSIRWPVHCAVAGPYAGGGVRWVRTNPPLSG